MGHLDCGGAGGWEGMKFNLEARNSQLGIIFKEETATFISITKKPHTCTL